MPPAGRPTARSGRRLASCLPGWALRTQEHCTVYNMMRLAEYLLRWTGDPAYADYWERNLWNGVLAQQHPDTGMIAYFLPLQPGRGEGLGHAHRRFLVLPRLAGAGAHHVRQ